MAGLSQQEKNTIRADLKASGQFTDEQIEMTIGELDKSAGGGDIPEFERSVYDPGGQALKTLPPMLLGGVGGSVGRKFLAKYLTRPLAAGIGEMLGSTLGFKYGTGMPWREAAQAGTIAGGVGTVVEGGTNLLGRGLATLAGVGEEATERAFARGPIGSAKVTRFPKLFRGSPPPEAEDLLVGKLREEWRKEVPGMADAEAALKAHQGTIPAGPIKVKVAGLLREPVGEAGRYTATPAEDVANEALMDTLRRLPKRFKSLKEMHEYLKRIRQPIEEDFGRVPKSLAKRDIKTIQGTTRAYRDRILGGESSPGAQAFKKAEARLDALDDLADILTETEGGQKLSAEAKIRSIMKNRELMRRVAAVNPELLEEMTDLAMQREWSKTPTGWHRLGVLARPAARLGAFGARPLGQGAAMMTSLLEALEAQKQSQDPMNYP